MNAIIAYGQTSDGTNLPIRVDDNGRIVIENNIVPYVTVDAAVAAINSECSQLICVLTNSVTYPNSAGVWIYIPTAIVTALGISPVANGATILDVTAATGTLIKLA